MLHVFQGEGNALELLTYAVRQVWGFEKLPEISRLPDGKPFFMRYPDCHFNLSHSGEIVLCALSDQPVGVDVECICPRREGFPEYVFKGSDYERYQALGGDWAAFYTLWTEVESIIKYTGEGLKAWRRARTPEDCVITNLIGDGWRGAVCAHETASSENIQNKTV